MDVQKDCFIIGELGGYLHLQYYNQKQPSACFSVQEIEKQTGIKSFNLRWREIRHTSFDHTFNEKLFAFMTAELCCVYDITNPTTPISILTVHNCLIPMKKANVVVQFHSFAFCGNGQMLVITDKDVFRWDYFHSNGKIQTLSSVYHHSNKSSFRRICFKPNGNLIGMSRMVLFHPHYSFSRDPFNRLHSSLPLHSTRWGYHSTAFEIDGNTRLAQHHCCQASNHLHLIVQPVQKGVLPV